ncbi:MupA/Atu3671 family FMN-dependent luciferase-like monooxygenase [Polaromonas sp.]|jgi:natural product biosynthesis luciferase-like monooxygenase protein|uniref:MupA/Atu3671 family FMN-dependent luciferase-like monooxygenase n=1 Tax=Polaromonas sp. TaxID=1869339 RepID=UPI002C27D2D9|nr:MupA/Atu3671 family FMN-dependent luciferase-like monooxygenase [Polaromonas sp.]HQS31158.1 LLM class flavin-dependent oxidoreductase [Polaromonas sp.]HQS90294.1 LLM class flavin-dependent oxidoreductase [Polaromonas sp.]
MVSATAVFVGNGSLLISCAEAYRQAGHSIEAVATHNPEIQRWAETLGLRCVRMEDALPLSLPDARFDYLFSVANLTMIPASLLAQAGRLAINFHDALLPAYAGLNATSWALMAQEKQHGVTWHEMTPVVDAGRIVRQASFDISDEETALSLNAKCYEAGLATFLAIVQDIGQGALSLTPQTGLRGYYGRHRRPDALATLDFHRPARELASLVRALEFGHYPNSLCQPRIYTGRATLALKSARVSENASTVQPGTVLSVSGDEWRVATADKDLILIGCSHWDGEPARGHVAPGDVLPALAGEVVQRLAACAERVAQGEVFWRHALSALEPVELPYPRRTSGAAPANRQSRRVSLGVPAANARTVAGFFAWLAALTGQERVSVMYSDATLSEQADGIEAWLTPWVPLTLPMSPSAVVAEAVAHSEKGIENVRASGPYAHDLPSRLGGKPASPLRMGKLGVCLRHGALPDDLDLLVTTDAAGNSLELVVDTHVFDEETIEAMARHLAFYLTGFETAGGQLADLALVPPDDAEVLAALNATAVPFDAEGCVHEAIAAQAARTPDHAAVCFGGQNFSYQQINDRSDAVARGLVARGVKPGDVVGLYLERTPDLVVALLAIQKTGAAYLPLDPEYPADRLTFMIEDSHTPLVVSSAVLAARLKLGSDKTFLMDGLPRDTPDASSTLPPACANSAAYVIYTSGSTGKPKGVVVTHRNVMNFFAGMTARIPHEGDARWLAVTSLSFDISVLELCWTLTRGFTVVLHSKHAAQPAAPATSIEATTQFSLFYFASEDSSSPADRYKLLIEGAKFADAHGFHAVWTPERHFHAFGGLYPNPAVTSAAIAAITTRVKIRAGSCVLPLHHPIRVAEDWAFVDNISQGRVGVSFAAGWQPNDFVIAPEAFANRKTDMLRNIDVVRRLWRGEAVAFPGPVGKPVTVRTLPRPIQAELPIWLTAAGNPETFEQAGEMGCNLLTHLLGQTTDELTQKLALYRAAWQRAGHAGQGHVTLMLHTFVGDDEEAVRAVVREPMKAYLRSSMDLIKQAAWSFPTFVERGAAHGKSPVEIMDSEELSPEDMDALLEHAFSRYYATSGLFGTPGRCVAMAGKLRQAGVDEIACLIDFGIDTDTVLAHLNDLKEVMDGARTTPPAFARASVADDISRHTITHLQCTPSMASMLVADASGRAALSRLSALLVGGEALPLDLARQLRALVPGALMNMYGPTETTIWSTTCHLEQPGNFVPLGQPIANTRLSIRTPGGLECPAGVPGELLIGGEGVAGGYLHRPELTAERFIGLAAEPASRWYRTGDLVRRHADGALEFLGRIDNQVKIRGHRIELGEIESALARQPHVREAVVVARRDAGGEPFLVAYVTARDGLRVDVDAVRTALAQELPEIMVPRAVIVLQAWPLTPNGKVDRRALPEAGPVIAPRPESAPASQLEGVISTIWRDVLGLDKVGTSDNFFDLGGHSLLVVQVQRRLRAATGREVSITDMFRLTTIEGLAAHLGGNGTQSAVSDGQSRANARRVMRSRGLGQQPANTVLVEVSHGN